MLVHEKNKKGVKSFSFLNKVGKFSKNIDLFALVG
jgi:hypothetical protein